MPPLTSPHPSCSLLVILRRYFNSFAFLNLLCVTFTLTSASQGVEKTHGWLFSGVHTKQEKEKKKTKALKNTQNEWEMETVFFVSSSKGHYRANEETSVAGFVHLVFACGSLAFSFLCFSAVGTGSGSGSTDCLAEATPKTTTVGDTKKNNVVYWSISSLKTTDGATWT